MELTVRELDEINSRPWTEIVEGCSPLQVLKSNAGYYVGRTFDDGDGFLQPYCRESGYFDTQERANLALEYLLALDSLWEMEKGE